MEMIENKENLSMNSDMFTSFFVFLMFNAVILIKLRINPNLFSIGICIIFIGGSFENRFHRMIMGVLNNFLINEKDGINRMKNEYRWRNNNIINRRMKFEEIRCG